MDTTQIVADAKALGVAALGDARSAAVQLLTSLGSDVEAGIPKISGDAASLLNEFVPAQFAPFVDPILTTAEGAPLQAVDAAAVTAVKTGIGIAIARIEALLPAPSAGW
jgi:hypothetical protein